MSCSGAGPYFKHHSLLSTVVLFTQQAAYLTKEDLSATTGMSLFLRQFRALLQPSLSRASQCQDPSPEPSSPNMPSLEEANMKGNEKDPESVLLLLWAKASVLSNLIPFHLVMPLWVQRDLLNLKRLSLFMNK